MRMYLCVDMENFSFFSFLLCYMGGIKRATTTKIKTKSIFFSFFLFASRRRLMLSARCGYYVYEDEYECVESRVSLFDVFHLG